MTQSPPAKSINASSAALDYRNPDYSAIFRRRIQALARIRKEPEKLPLLKMYYRDHPWQFISDWGCTIDPRNVERGLPAVIPFILFPKQIEWCQWFVAHWKGQKPGITEKSRDMGVSWLSTSLSCTLCLFYVGMAIGFGSRKEEYVDKAGDPKSLFYKARAFMSSLPPEFRGGWTLGHAPHMRIFFPETGSTMTGEAGDNIGRGDRTSVYIVDEAAYLERPQLVEASLSQTTNCRMDVSSANGRANPFAEKRFAGNIDVFTFHWRDDPRKDDAWYEKQKRELPPVVVAQEIDINYAASVEGLLIPSEWVQAAIDAHKKLGIEPTGANVAALDVADEGKDKNAFAGGRGVVVELLEEWSGKGSDIFSTVQRAFELCDDHGLTEFWYDSDGLGAGVRGDARVINDSHRVNRRKIRVEPFRGSGEVVFPEREDVKGRKNKDYFQNAKAQAWWRLRIRFQNTYRAVVEKQEVDKDEIISLPSSLKLLQKLCVELSQPTYHLNAVGKIVVDKAPDGTMSPNLADAVMIKFAPKRGGLALWEKLAG